MNDHTKLWLVAVSLALASIVTAPTLTTAMAEQLASAKIAVMAPGPGEPLGTIWFDLKDGSDTAGVWFGGPR